MTKASSLPSQTSSVSSKKKTAKAADDDIEIADSMSQEELLEISKKLKKQLGLANKKLTKLETRYVNKFKELT